MFLQPRAGLDTLQVASQITVLLTPDEGKPHLLPATVVRQGENGVGIQFHAPLPERIVAWLHQQTTKSQTPHSAITKAFLQEFTATQGKASLTAALDVFFKHYEAHMLDAAARCGNNAATAFFEAIHWLKQKGNDLRTAILHEYAQRSDRFFSADSSTPPPPPEPSANGLSLIDQNDFEDWLNVTETAAPLESRYHDILQRLEFLYAQVVRHNDQLVRIPLCPAFMGECLRTSLQTLAIEDLTVRKAIYQAFFQALQAPFAQVIETAQQTFGIDPLKPIAPLHPTPSKTSPDAEDAPPDDENTSEPETRPSTAPADIDTRTSAKHASSPIRLLSQVLETNYQLQTDEQTRLEQLEELLTAWEEQAEAPPDHSTDILSALQGLARETERTLPPLTPGLQNRLQTANCLTRALITETGATNPAVDSTRQLQIPLMRLALRQPELFEAEDSPAVRLVNQLDKAGQWASGNPTLAKTLDEFIQTLTSRLRHCPAEEMETRLGQAVETLQAILEPVQEKRQRHLQRLIDSYVGRQRITQARLAVYQALEHHFGDEPVIELLLELLDLGWFHLLVLIHINHGRDSDPWQHGFNVLIRLHEWLAADPETELPVGEAETLIDQIDRRLGQISDNSIRQQQLIQRLNRCLLGPEQGRQRQRLTRRRLEPSRFLDPRTLRKPRRLPAEIRNLRVGEWIRIQKDGKPHPFKLIWIGDNPPLYVFVDPSGLSKLELKPKQLALLFRNHAAARISNLDLPLLDRATDRVLNELRTPPVQLDPITGLADRKSFLHHLRYALWRSGSPQEFHVICQFELDLLQTIATVCGEDAEETLLQHVTQLLRANIPDNALPARLRDNVFAILLPEHSLQAALGVAQKLSRALASTRFRHGDQDYTLDSPIGLVPFSWGDRPETVLLNANATCMKARNRGRNSIEIYKESDRGIEQEKNLLIWAGRINQLFEQDQLFLRCQLIAPLRDGIPRHYEILVSARDENGEVLPPDKFIPAVEHFHRGPEMDRWIVKQVIDWLEQHPHWRDPLGGFSVNLSGQSLLEAEFRTFLETLLQQHPELVRYLTFEITETAAVGSFEQAGHFIRSIKRLGCRFSLDDFGTGYASYAYLKHLDFDYLKIDGSFIRTILDSSSDEEIVKSMNHIGHSLGLRTVAEYVENDAIRQKMLEIGVDYGQGYGIAKPIPLAELTFD